MYETLSNEPTLNPELPITAELHKGQFLGQNQNYRLEEPLGVGGMGEVWLASEIRNGQELRKVVVKTLKANQRESDFAREKVLNQFRLIQSLNHQNICPIYTIEEDAACGYLIVMGYAAGGSYADWFAKQPKQNGGLPIQTVCDVLCPIADALDFAHRKGVIHRDVKPENMMFTSDQTPWLIDFGIASNLRSETRATTGQYASSGTVSYMAPEQKTGQLQTAQTDEYSLAMVALEFLTGSTFIQAIGTLSPEIQQVLNKGLALKPSDRYATCREFIDALSGTTLPASSNLNDAGSIVPVTAKSSIDQIVEQERLVAEAKRRAEEEALRKRIQELEDSAAEEYQSARYTDAITHLNELLKLRPNHPNTQWLLKNSQEKLEVQKKEEAERLVAEAKRRAEEEALQKRIQELDEKAAKAYQSQRYADAITHLTALLKLIKPDYPNYQYMLKSCQEKLEVLKKEEAERKVWEEARRKERLEFQRKVREEAERKAGEEVERKKRDWLCIVILGLFWGGCLGCLLGSIIVDFISGYRTIIFPISILVGILISLKLHKIY